MNISYKFHEFVSSMLYALNPGHKKEFKEKSSYYKDIYVNHLKNSKYNDNFVEPMWQSFTQDIENFFIKDFNSSFLNNPVIRKTMFISGRPGLQDTELNFLESIYPKEKLRLLIKESWVGSPILTNLRYLTSHNTIHHLYHLTKFSIEMGKNLTDIDSIVEWGGGYGNMARLMLKINPDIRYTIIDLPIFSSIQAIYLSSIFGEEKVNLVYNDADFSTNRINIVPINNPNIGKINNADLFISTWALSESSNLAQQFVEDNNFFNARNLLIAHQRISDHTPYSEDIKDRIARLNYSIKYHQEIDGLKNNYYLFARN